MLVLSLVIGPPDEPCRVLSSRVRSFEMGSQHPRTARAGAGTGGDREFRADVDGGGDQRGQERSDTGRGQQIRDRRDGVDPGHPDPPQRVLYQVVGHQRVVLIEVRQAPGEPSAQRCPR